MAASLPMLPHIRRLLDPSALDLGSDAALVRRFVDAGDEEAFAVLVARHGPMVLRLCRRVLGDTHAAEDACQAAFLVLARKAAGIRHAETLAAWLHGVAYRLALKARAVEVRRRQAETRSLQLASSSPVDPLAEVSGRELLAILDAELQRLPERYRLPLILCCLEGRSQPEAARLLGWTAGSVKGRLERGRAKLHQRLLRRGLTLPAALLALEAAQGAATARMPAALTTSIVRAIGGGVSAGVAALAESGITGVVGMKVKIAFLLVLMLGAVTAGVGLLAQSELVAWPAEGKPATPNADPPKAVQPKPAKEQARTDRYGDPLPPGAIARLGTIRLRPGEYTHLIACSPDGKNILSVASEEGGMRVCVWRMSTGELLRQLESPSRIFRAVTLFASDGKTLVLAGFSRQDEAYHVLLWDVASGKRMGELAGTGRVSAGRLAFASDGKTFATAGEDETLRLWDRDSRTELRRFEGAKGKWHRLAFSADGKTLVSLGEDSTVQYWDVATGKAKRTLKLDSGSERIFALSPDGKILATGANENKTVRLWDIATGKEVRQLQSDSRTSTLAFSPDSKLLATGGERVEGKVLTTSPIRLWDVDTGQELRCLRGHLFGVFALAFSPDGERLISGGSGGPLRVWDVSTGKELLPFAEHQSYVCSVAFSPDGRLVATGGLDGSIRLWEPASGKPARRFPDGHRQRVFRVTFAADGRTLVSYGHDGSFRFWDVATGREKRQVKAVADHNSFASSPDGKTLVVWRKDGTVRLLDGVTGEERRRLTGIAGADAAFLRLSPDGSKLTSLSFSLGARTGVLQVWDTATGTEMRKWSVAQAGQIAFSPDGRTLMGAIGGDFLPAGQTKRTGHLWDITTGEDRSFIVTQRARVFAVTVSPDGRMLAWGDTEGTVTLWDLAASQVRRRLQGQHSDIDSLAFSPDGKTLASGSADTTVLLWDVTGWPAVAQTGPLSAERVRVLWDDLASQNACKAFDAIGLLTATTEQAVPLLKEKLRPAPAPADRQQVARLIADLDNDEFAVRQKAREELRRLDERAEPGLRAALRGKLTLEARKRIEELLEGVRVSAASPEKLRVFRAVEVLEHIGTPAARDVLKTLADGASEARLTREAKASLERLSKRRTTRNP